MSAFVSAVAAVRARCLSTCFAFACVLVVACLGVHVLSRPSPQCWLFVAGVVWVVVVAAVVAAVLLFICLYVYMGGVFSVVYGVRVFFLHPCG